MDECKPKVIRIEQETERDGTYWEVPIHNCQECNNKECEFYLEYNDED